MVRFAPEEIIVLITFLELLATPDVPQMEHRYRTLTSLHGFDFSKLRQACTKLRLAVSVRHIDDATHELGTIKDGDVEELTKAFFRQHGPAIADTIRREMSTKLFLAIPDEASIELFANERPFDTVSVSVNDHFPDAVYDIQEAANCLALSRGTECVCHLMRVLEAGLCALCKELNIPWPEQNNWFNVINQIEPAIKRIEQGVPRLPPDFRIKRQVYAEAATQFTHFKDAWRNYAMHLHANYDEHKATIIFNSVGEFMRVLASADITSIQRRESNTVEQ
jgi:hypothetical protein